MTRKKKSRQPRKRGKRMRLKAKRGFLSPTSLVGKATARSASQIISEGSPSTQVVPGPLNLQVLAGRQVSPATQSITYSEIAAASGLTEQQVIKISTQVGSTPQVVEKILAIPEATEEILGRDIARKVSRTPKVRSLRQRVKLLTKDVLRKGGGRKAELVARAEAVGIKPSIFKSGTATFIYGSLLAELLISLSKKKQEEKGKMELQNQILTSQSSPQAVKMQKETAKNELLLQFLIPALQNKASISQQAASAALSPGFNPTRLAPSEVLIGSPGGGSPGNQPATSTAQQDQLALLQALQTSGQ